MPLLAAALQTPDADLAAIVLGALMMGLALFSILRHLRSRLRRTGTAGRG